MRMIDADALCKWIEELFDEEKCRTLEEAISVAITKELIIETIRNSTTVDEGMGRAKKRNGRWDQDHQCTVCGSHCCSVKLPNRKIINIETPFCPCYGAKMMETHKDAKGEEGEHEKD